MNKIILPKSSEALLNKSLKDDELFRKNVIILDKIRQTTLLFGIDNGMNDLLQVLLQYFESVEAYEYCTDIQKVYELDDELYPNE